MMYMRSAPLSPSRSLTFLFVLAIFLSSCVSQKKIKYLQQATEDDTTTMFINKIPMDYLVKPGDNLYITIKSLSKDANEIFNQFNESNVANTANASLYLTSYSVNKEGYINFPVLGKVEVKDKTVQEVEAVMQKQVDEYLKESVVIVRLVNFTITMLGEVKMPGNFEIYQDEITIFEAISLAGDMTDFANRKQVSLVRQTETGSKIYNVDLNSASILSSPYYYLKPNDMIYIAPLPVKQYGFSTFPYALVFSSISLILSLIIFFNTL